MPSGRQIAYWTGSFGIKTNLLFLRNEVFALALLGHVRHGAHTDPRLFVLLAIGRPIE